MATPDVALPYEAYRGQQFSEAQAKAAKLEMDKAEPGGKYKQADGSFVDANGRPLGSKAEHEANPGNAEAERMAAELADARAQIATLQAAAKAGPTGPANPTGATGSTGSKGDK